jgi:hypothetical protein
LLIILKFEIYGVSGLAPNLLYSFSIRFNTNPPSPFQLDKDRLLFRQLNAHSSKVTYYIKRHADRKRPQITIHRRKKDQGRKTNNQELPALIKNPSPLQKKWIAPTGQDENFLFPMLPSGSPRASAISS